MSKFKYALAAVLAALLTSALPAWAEEYTWRTDVEEGYFTDVNNWSPTPSTTNTGTFVINSGHVNLNSNLPNDQNVIVNDGELTMQGCSQEYDLCGSSSITLYGGELTTSLDYLAFANSASLTLYGGVFTASCSIIYLYDNASVTLSGGTINIGSYAEWEGEDDAPFRITDGTINAPSGLSLENSDFIMSGGTINLGGSVEFAPWRTQIYGGTLGTCGVNTGWSTDEDDIMGCVEDGCTLTFAPESGKTIELSESQGGNGNLILDGAGTLQMDSAQYTGSTTINNGTLQLGADSTLNNLSGGSENNYGTLDAAGKNLIINTSGDEAKKYVGSITAKNITVNATDDAPFQVYTAANGAVRAESFVVSSGRVDVKGCMEAAVKVQSDATFSPGNSVGTVEVTGDVAITSNGIALFEFSSFSKGKYDQIIINGDGSFTADDSTIKLYFESGDVSSWAIEGSKYKLVSNGGFTDGGDYSTWLSNYTDLFELKGGSDGLYLIGHGEVPEPVAGVPEPSTWALLILGAAGLMYVRKRTRK